LTFVRQVKIYKLGERKGENGAGVFMNEGSQASDPLRTYRKKRDFSITSEPSGERAVSSGQIFVVQEHNSRRLHYDLRLEVDGVLKSWAVPKGPSLDPRDKRLAIQTEDHPLEYALFQGTIPQGQYGAGTVVVWDTGPYRNMTQKDGEDISMAQALHSGHAAFWLVGKKLKGGYALTRTKRRWILVKMKDEMAKSLSENAEDTQPRSAGSP
jgi:DNA ligase D-like protein (predicted 3'-phosphoesterase)